MMIQNQLVVLFVSSFVLIGMTLFTAVRGFSLRQIRGNAHLPFKQLPRKRLPYAMVPAGCSVLHSNHSQVDCSTQSFTNISFPVKPPRMTLRKMSLSTTASLSESCASSTAVVEDTVERTLFQEILPVILSDPSANSFHGENNGYRTNSSHQSSSNSGGIRHDVTIVLGVSGGCDSIALLRVLQKVLFHSDVDASNPAVHWNLIVAHFDHQQRGEESNQDCIFVQSLCQQLNVPCFVYKWNESLGDGGAVQSFSQATARLWRRATMQQLLSEQLQARRNLYEIDPLMMEEGSVGGLYPARFIGMIMTAHHRDDSDETVLLKILRGVHITNIAGLSSVQPCSDPDIQGSNFDDGAFRSVPTRSIPFVTASPMYWVRPLIHVRKADIIHFLKSHNYVWREDHTNQSDKYLRNRVRNELIPLLKDLMGGSAETMERRIDNLQEQASDIRYYLNDQVLEYMEKYVSNDMFLLAKRIGKDEADYLSSLSLNLVMKEALYSWTLGQTQGFHVSYEQMQRVYQQLIDYPAHRKWQLNLGQHWTMIRFGDSLRLVQGGTDSQKDLMDKDYSSTIAIHGKVCMTNAFYPVSSAGMPATDWLHIQIPKLLLESRFQFLQSTVGNWSQYKLHFTPPWRKANRPIRVNDFLRGQNIPLHIRESTPILVMFHQQQTLTSDEEVLSAVSLQPIPPTLVAVYVSSRRQWVVDHAFCVKEELSSTNDALGINECARQLYIVTFAI